jgi:hypothetical protein
VTTQLDTQPPSRYSRVKLCLEWILAHAIAGAIAGALENGGFQFSASLIFKGALTGIAQWLVLRQYIQQTQWWAIATSVGWVAGQFLKIAIWDIFPILQERPLVGLIPAAWMAIAQALVLPSPFTPLLVWVAASAIGGMIDSLVGVGVNQLLWYPMLALLPGKVTGIWVAAVIDSCGWAAYGATTGLALLWLWKRQAILTTHQ